MLSREVQDRIVEFVRLKPRTVQEIAHLLQKNWRTADRYVQRIGEETGVLGVRTFREGSRGALKVVFYAALEPGTGSEFEQRLMQRVVSGRKKEDFSAFDVFQFATARKAFLTPVEFASGASYSVDDSFRGASAQVLFFSGNLSWLTMGDAAQDVYDAARRGVRIKVLSRLDVTSLGAVESVRALNARCGWDAVEVRHSEQPVRGFVVDDTRMVLKEQVYASRVGETGIGKFMFFSIEDPSWVSWMQKVFWHLWGSAVDAEVRIGALREVRD